MKWTNRGHQFDALGAFFRDRKILIYGASLKGKEFYDLLVRVGIAGNVEGFVDKKWKDMNDGYLGRPVFSPERLFCNREKNCIIIVAMLNEQNGRNIFNRLIRAGYLENIEVFFPDKFIGSLNDIYLPVYAMYACNKLILSSACTIPSTACNLNCENCLNFTPHIKQFETRSLEEVCGDLNTLFSVVDYIFEFQISGGEPLLYPYLAELIKYIGENYQDQIGRFETVLNGTVVPSDKICEVIKKYNMTVILDNYTKQIPENLNRREEIVYQIKKYDLLWIDNTVEDWFDLDIEGTDNSNMEEGYLQEYFDICNNPWHFYENGNFYSCNFARFAEKADMNSEPDSSRYDIRHLDSAKRIELMEFLLNYNEKGYVELCKHCSGWAECNPKRVPVAKQKKRKPIE